MFFKFFKLYRYIPGTGTWVLHCVYLGSIIYIYCTRQYRYLYYKKKFILYTGTCIMYIIIIIFIWVRYYGTWYWCTCFMQMCGCRRSQFTSYMYLCAMLLHVIKLSLGTFVLYYVQCNFLFYSTTTTGMIYNMYFLVLVLFSTYCATHTYLHPSCFYSMKCYTAPTCS